ncbi:MAG: cytochrome c biogenesis protein CcsA [Alistipes sp.]|nr:cytochrome c biogenesis protein CcsA [Alistipes sp.]
MKESKRISKYIAFGSMALLILLLAMASIVEKIYGSAYAYERIYGSAVTITLWAIMGLSAIIYLIKAEVWRHWATFLFHLSLGIILTGALTTHLLAKQGQLHLRRGEAPIKQFILDSGTPSRLPFRIALCDFRMEYYPGTLAPMDYVSTLTITDDGETFVGKVSMNNILSYRSYRLYQSGYDPDGEGATLSVSYDPYGIAATYIGYALLLLSMLLFLLQPKSRFRALWSSSKRHVAIALLLICTSTATLSAKEAESAPSSVTAAIAEEFGNLHIYYHDRICPMQTLARDFTIKLYGKDSYKGLSAEQILCGWLFFPSEWESEPMLKIKGTDIVQLLGIEGKYASIADFVSAENGYKLTPALHNPNGKYNKANIAAANEKFNLVNMLCTGSLLRIYPYYSNEDNVSINWYSPIDTLPQGISEEESLFIRQSLILVAQNIMQGKEDEARTLLTQIGRYQLNRMGEHAPSTTRFKAEKLYNATSWSRPLAMLCMTLGILAFILLIRRRRATKVNIGLALVMLLVWLYLTLHIALRWYISRHVPLSNGFETMQFMAWCSLLVAQLAQRRFHMAQSFGLLICGFALLVAMMGEANPRITQLMPVLQSPLLSIHVMVIMIAYSLFAFMMLNGVMAITLRLSHTSVEAEGEIAELHRTSRLMLYPALFLLTAGIFIGAVWANISWGRYWGWDPKEVWALITMLIYAFALHSDSIKVLRRPMVFHIFCILAFLSVLITYFGVNFFLGGMHSYA